MGMTSERFCPDFTRTDDVSATADVTVDLDGVCLSASDTSDESDLLVVNDSCHLLDDVVALCPPSPPCFLSQSVDNFTASTNT